MSKLILHKETFAGVVISMTAHEGRTLEAPLTIRVTTKRPDSETRTDYSNIHQGLNAYNKIRAELMGR